MKLSLLRSLDERAFETGRVQWLRHGSRPIVEDQFSVVARSLADTSLPISTYTYAAAAAAALPVVVTNL